MAGRSFGVALGELIRSKRNAQGLTQLQLAEDAYASPAKLRRIVELETGSVDRPHPKTIDPLIHALGITQEELDRCALVSGQTPDVELDRAYSEARNLIDAVAKQFEHANPDATMAELDSFLRAKAREWRVLKERIEQLDGPENTLSNLKAQATAALAEGDFSGADDLLASAEDLQQQDRTLAEVRRQSAIRVARGDAALMQGDVSRAREFYIGAANFFRPFDANECISTLSSIAAQLYAAGRHALLPSFEVAAALLEAALEVPEMGEDPEFEAKTHYQLGLIYRTASELQTGPKLDQYINLAIAHARLGILASESNNEEARFDLASAKIGLANCLFQSAKMEGGSTRLREAVDTLRELRIELEQSGDFPVLLAHACNSLGGALMEWLSEDELSPTLFDEGLGAFEAAVKASERAIAPDAWGAAKANIGRALSRKARSDGIDPDFANFLRVQAIAAHSDALEMHHFARFPLFIADTHKSLGESLVELGMFGPPYVREMYIMRAIYSYEVAGGIITESRNPLGWAAIQIAVARALTIQAQVPGIDSVADIYKAAIGRLDEAKRVFETHGEMDRAKYCVESAGRVAAELAKSPV